MAKRRSTIADGYLRIRELVLESELEGLTIFVLRDMFVVVSYR